MSMIDARRGRPGADPQNLAEPCVNTPPSAPTSQYPPPEGVAAMPTIGPLSFFPASEPCGAAFP